MIDAAIPLAGQAPQITSPMNLLTQAGNIQAQQQEAQQRDLQMQGQRLALAGQQQSAQDQADSRAAYAAAVDPQTGQVDRKTLLSTLGKLNPAVAAQTASTLATQDTAASEAKAKLDKAQLEAATAHVDAKDRLLQGVTDQATYTNALQQGIASGIIKQGDLPGQYDPQLVAQLHSQTLSQKEQLAQQNKTAEDQRAAAAQTETVRHNKAAETETALYQKGQLGIEGGKLNLEKKKFDLLNGTGGANGLVDEIGTGKMAVDRLGYLLARNPELMSAVAAKYPDFDSSKVASYIGAYKDFTSSKNGTAGGTLNAAATAFKHLQELQQLNTLESRIPGTADHQRYQNKVDTVAPELAKTYNDSTVSGIEGYKKTLNATFNRDAAITEQAKSMGDKVDSLEQTWKNAAPSKAYQAPVPGMDAQAQNARAALDPRYKPQGGSQGGSQPAPEGTIIQTADGPKIKRGGQWVTP